MKIINTKNTIVDAMIITTEDGDADNGSCCSSPARRFLNSCATIQEIPLVVDMCVIVRLTVLLLLLFVRLLLLIES